jgi:hypothetical protein
MSGQFDKRLQNHISKELTSMKYINPYDISERIQFKDLKSDNFKKFKRRLLAELDLSDNELTIRNQTYTLNDFNELTKQIENNKYLLFNYNSIYENSFLNNFLYQQYNIHDIKKIKNILSLEQQDTIKLIMPYIINIFSKIYKNAFINSDTDILSLELPVNKIYLESVYEPLYKILKNQEAEINNLKNESYDIHDVVNIIDIDTINHLPDYFSKVRDDIAYAIRGLSIDSWNDDENLEQALGLITDALKIKVSQKTRDKLLEDKKDLENIKKSQYSTEIVSRIEDIMKKRSRTLNQKLEALLSVLRSEINDDLIAVATFKIIMDYINDKPEELVASINNLKKVLKQLQMLSSNYELQQVLNSNLKDLDSLKSYENASTSDNWIIRVWNGIWEVFGGFIVLYVIVMILSSIN